MYIYITHIVGYIIQMYVLFISVCNHLCQHKEFETIQSCIHRLPVVCVYICIYIYTYIYVYINMYVYIHNYTCTFIHIYKYVYVDIYIYINVCT